MTTPPTPKESKYANLVMRGQVIDYPAVEYTVSGDNRFRSALADYGFGYYVISVAQVGVNVLSADRSGPTGAQQYFGQKFTALDTEGVSLLYDFSRFGLENGQLWTAAQIASSSWAPAAQSKFAFGAIVYRQTFLKELFELKLGYVQNNLEYYGQYVGGNIAASIFGASGSVPTQLGLSQGTSPRPGANLKVSVGNLYEKFGVQLSSSPDGYIDEYSHNKTGLGWATPNTGPLLLNEVGFKRIATSTKSKTWVRFGYMRNFSEFTDYQFGGRSNKAYAFYILGDHQFLKFSGGPPSRGINIGFSGVTGLDRYQPIAQTYEGRLYVTGPLESRPTDMASFIATYNTFSEYAVDKARAAGSLAHDASWTLTWAYSATIAPGVFAGLGLAYTNNPSPITYTPTTGHSLELVSNLGFFL